MGVITAKRGSWALAAWAGLLLAVGLALRLARPIGIPAAQQPFDTALLAVAVVVMSMLGAFVASRQPRNPIGWAFLAFGLSSAYTIFAVEYAVRAVRIAPGSLPLADWAAWLADWTTFPTGWVPVLLVPYLFPTGRLVSKRWGAGLGIGIGAMGLICLDAMFAPLLLRDDIAHLANPVASNAIGAVLRRIIGPIGGIVWFLPFVSLAIGAVSVIVRYRRAHGVLRQQMKWIAFSGIFVITGAVLMIIGATTGTRFLTDTEIVPAFIIVGMGSLPITTTIAMVRYRLFDVDRLIRRTIAYIVVTVVLGAIYVVLVLLPVLVIGTEDAPDALVAAATLVAAAAFIPVRRRVQNAIDRRFNRARYDAARTIELFTARLRQEIDIDALGTELRSVVGQTMQPSTVGLWVPTTKLDTASGSIPPRR
jgi:hypothetical protein